MLCSPSSRRIAVGQDHQSVACRRVDGPREHLPSQRSPGPRQSKGRLLDIASLRTPGAVAVSRWNICAAFARDWHGDARARAGRISRHRAPPLVIPSVRRRDLIAACHRDAIVRKARAPGLFLDRGSEWPRDPRDPTWTSAPGEVSQRAWRATPVDLHRTGEMEQAAERNLGAPSSVKRFALVNDVGADAAIAEHTLVVGARVGRIGSPQGANPCGQPPFDREAACSVACRPRLSIDRPSKVRRLLTLSRSS
jgi:hypothetical protein